MTQELLEKRPKRWHLTTETNRKSGNTYIIAYTTEWNKVERRSKRTAKRHVGRLQQDGSVTISPNYLKDHPEMAHSDWFWGADKNLVDRETFLEYFPPSPGPKPDAEDVERNDIISVGTTLVAQEFAYQSGVLKDLQIIFGDEVGDDILNLCLYLLDGNRAMSGFDLWQNGVYLKHNRRLSGQSISRLLSKITLKNFDAFFKRRHEYRLDERRKLNAKQPSNQSSRALEYALDSTSIGTYSETIEEAAFGHAKQNPELKQINHAVICEQLSGEIVYAHCYKGSLNDVTSLSTILARMIDVGINLEDVLLVTDRGYNSMLNVQRMINTDVKFVQGVRVVEKALKTQFDRYKESLENVAFFDPTLEVFARTITEPWQHEIGGGALVTEPVHVHLFKYLRKNDDSLLRITKAADNIVQAKEEGKLIDSETWQGYRRFVKEVRTSDGQSHWQRDNDAIQEALRYAGCFVLRSNEINNAFDALKIYRQRQMVELDFSFFKNWVSGDQLRCTDSAYIGKLFIYTLATSLRMMMLQTAKRNESDKNKIPNNSLDRLMTYLKQIYAEKRPTANAWVMRMITKKQRDALSLLGIKKLPKILN